MCRERTELKFSSHYYSSGDSCRFFFGITRTEWIVIILCIGVVIAAELFNTAIEKLVDLVSPERHPIAGQVKTLPPEQCWCALLRRQLSGLLFSPVFKLRGRGKRS